MPVRKSNSKKTSPASKRSRSRKITAGSAKKAVQARVKKASRKTTSTAKKLWQSAEELIASATKSARKRLSA